MPDTGPDYRHVPSIGIMVAVDYGVGEAGGGERVAGWGLRRDAPSVQAQGSMLKAVRLTAQSPRRSANSEGYRVEGGG